MALREKDGVLFVCLGNICRSPLAEAAFRSVIKEHGIAPDIDSAGTGSWHVGHPPDTRAQAVARRNGIEIGHYRARRICPEDFERFNHIVVMDHANLETVRNACPSGARPAISLLLDHVQGRTGEGVADPYFGEADGFDVTWRDVEDGARALARRLAAGEI